MSGEVATHKLLLACMHRADFMITTKEVSSASMPIS